MLVLGSMRWDVGGGVHRIESSPYCRLPEEREHHSMVAFGDVAYLHGGERLFRKLNQVRWLGDTWMYSFKNDQWRQLTTSGVPMRLRYVDEG